MKAMKLKYNRVIISVFVLSILFLGSCKKLDTYPITSYSENNFWKHPNHASAALNGAYSLLQLALNTEFVYYGEARADLVLINRENNIQSMGVINNALNVNMSFANWGNFYKIVQQCNLILKYVPIMLENNIYKSTDADSFKEYQRIMGQAHALRALVYFYMIRVWGEVPLVTEPTEVVANINDLKVFRSPMEAIHNQIIADLETAREFLNSHTSYPNAKHVRSHITRGAVDAIFTDFYLWIGDAAKAVSYANNLVNNSGAAVGSVYGYTELTGTTAAQRYTSEYAQMFYNGYSKESIFEIAFNMDENSTSSLFGIYGAAAQAQFSASDIALSKIGTSDPRRDVIFNTGSTKRYVYKFFEKVDFDLTQMNDKNVIIYRLADICLLKAEALIKRGQANDRQNALNLLNTIKRRANIGEMPESDFLAMTDEEALNEVLDERARELCYEGKRWFDLVRNNKAIEVMQPINGLSDPRNILWPINLVVIRQNPNIEQNEYYK